jgi:AcrR family transcriptional regulator
MKQLPKNQRRESILDAARDILIDRGVDTLSMPEIATRVGVSRQIIYLHFHGIDEVLEAVYDRTFHEYFEDLVSAGNGTDNLVHVGVARLERILELPPTIHQVVATAFFASPTSRQPQLMLQRRLFDMLETNWVEPLAELGIDSAMVTSGLYAIFASTLVFRDLIDRGVITRADANRQLRRLVNTLFRNPTVAHSL